MPSYTCTRCEKVWSSEEIGASIYDYGFVKFIGQDEEIIGFTCPDDNCLSLIAFVGPIGSSTHHIDACLYKIVLDYKFCYSSSFPLSKSSRDILSGFDVDHYFDYADGYENDLALFTSKRPELDTDYYCSFNSNHDEILGSYLTIWWYKKDDIKKLIEVEWSQKKRIFPRYIVQDDLLEKIDHFCWEYHLEKIQFAKVRKELRDAMKYSWNKESIAIQFDFLDLLTPPQGTHGVWHDDPSSKKSYDSFVRKHNESDYIWKNFHQKYIQEQLSSQSELFIRDYLDLYAKTNFCLPKVESLISRYRKQIYDGLISRRKKEKSRRQTVTELTSSIKKEAPAFDHIISENEKMLHLLLNLNSLVKNNARSFPILFNGETGTGKSFLAKAIREASGRKGRFVEVNAAAIASSIFESELFGHKKGAFSGATSDREGLFEAANGGTLFLDEIGEIDLSLQVKLLKAIEDGVVTPVGASHPVSVNVLMLFATNKNLNKAVDKGQFRQDLFYRINRFTYTIPPLRQRKKDILLLVSHFIEKYISENDQATVNISKGAQKQLLSYRWPGNIRELANVIEGIMMLRSTDDQTDISSEEISSQLPVDATAASISGQTDNSYGELNQGNIDISQVPNVIPAPGKRKMPDKEGIEQLLAYFHDREGKVYGVIKKTANHIGVDPTNLSREIKKLGIKFP